MRRRPPLRQEVGVSFILGLSIHCPALPISCLLPLGFWLVRRPCPDPGLRLGIQAPVSCLFPPLSSYPMAFGRFRWGRDRCDQSVRPSLSTHTAGAQVAY